MKGRLTARVNIIINSSLVELRASNLKFLVYLVNNYNLMFQSRLTIYVKQNCPLTSLKVIHALQSGHFLYACVRFFFIFVTKSAELEKFSKK